MTLSREDVKWLKTYRIAPEFHGLLRRVTDAEARAQLQLASKNGFLGKRSYAGLGFIGHDVWGKERGLYCVRRDVWGATPEDGKYMNPPKEAGPRYLYCLPGAPQSLATPGVLAVLVESPKSVLAVS